MVQQQCKESPIQQSYSITSTITFIVRKERKIPIHHCKTIAKIMSFVPWCQTKMRCLTVLNDHKTISGIHYITYPTITSVKHA